MRIDEQKGSIEPRVGATPLPQDGGTPPPPTATPPAGDQVSLSPAARALSGLRSELGDVDAVRQDRVARLREQVEQGTFRPDLQGTARSVLREVLGDLL